MNKKLFTNTANTFNKFLNQISFEGLFVNSDTIILNSSREDLKTLKIHKMVQYYHRTNKNTYAPTGFPLEKKTSLGVSFSPSGKKSCVIIRHKDIDYIEIYSQDSLTDTFSFPNLHGHIYPNPPLGGLSWSKTEDKILYIAEEKTEKEKSFTDLLSEPTDDSEKSAKNNATTNSNDQKHPSDSKKEIRYGEANLWEENWGERFPTEKRPRVYVLDLKNGEAKLARNLPAGYVFGEPKFLAHDEILVVGYEAKSPQFGLYAYNTRPSKIFKISLAGSERKKDDSNEPKLKNAEKNGIGEASRRDDHGPMRSKILGGTDDLGVAVLSAEDKSNYNTRVSPCGKFVLYFSTRIGDKVHFASERVRLLDVASGENRVLVDIETNPGDGEHEFPGVYSFSQPELVWSSSSDFVALNSFFRSRKVVLIVDASPKVAQGRKTETSLQCRFKELIATNRNRVFVLPLPAGFEDCSAQFSGVLEDRLVCKLSSPSRLPTVWCCDLRNQCSWKRVSPEIREIVGVKLCHSIVQKEFKTNNESLKSGFEYVFIHPDHHEGVSEKFPVIVLMHGGPHSTYIAEYGSTMAFLCSLGFAVCAVNYRGSLGFGDSFLKANLGKRNEVEDIIEALNDTLHRFENIVDPTSIGLLGGSHGGFLTCLLSGLFPDRFSAAVAINPVTNIPMLSATSDIPDWSFIECGLDFKDSLIPTPEEYKIMLEHSPVSLAEKVKTPTLLLLGEKDQRVPFLQNKVYSDILRKNGVKCKVHLYPGSGHSVSENVETKSNCLINTALWFIEHLKLNKTD